MKSGAIVANNSFCSALITIVLSLASLIFVCELDATGSEIFDTAVRYFKEGNYLLARRRFEYLLRIDPDCWPAHYQLANTYMKLNELTLARREYELGAKGADSATSALCSKAIAYIDATSRGGSATPPVELSSGVTASGTVRGGGTTDGTTNGARSKARRNQGVKSSSASPGADVKIRAQTLEDRVIVVQPRFGHPQVDASTVEMVKEAVFRLPDYVHSVLESGGATISIAPNATDRFPELMSQKMSRDNLDQVQAGGRCYGRDVYLYERPLLEGSTELGGKRSLGDMRNQVLHEIGHAVDDCFGSYSKTQEVLDLHSLDVSGLDPKVRIRLSYFTTPGPKGSMEACAELFSGCVGATGKDTEEVTKSFPRLKRWLQKKLEL